MTAIPTAERALKRSGVWMAIALLLVAAIYVRALVFTPEEATQGLAQKIFYIHAPSAWVAFLAFGVVGDLQRHLSVREGPAARPARRVLGGGRHRVHDGGAGDGADLGEGDLGRRGGPGTRGSPRRCSSGSSTWRTWCCASAVDEPGRRARYSAVLGILGALLVPFIHVSVYLFRTLHPMPVVLRPGKPELPGSMLADAAQFVRRLHHLLPRAARAPLRLGAPRGRAGPERGRPCRRLPLTAATWSRRTSPRRSSTWRMPGGCTGGRGGRSRKRGLGIGG